MTVAQTAGELFANPGRRRRDAIAASGEGEVRRFHARLPGYRSTRLAQAAVLASELGLRQMWVKDESCRLGLPSYKILGASWATYRALVDRLGAEPDWQTVAELREAVAALGDLTLVAATDGNHGRAVARVASWLGFDARILVPAGTAVARIAAIESEGATVEIVDGTYDDAVVKSGTLASESVVVVSDTSWAGYADIPRWTIDGYGTIWAEVDAQLGALSPDLVVVQMGVGSFAASAVLAFASRARVMVVEPVAAACGMRSAAAGRPTEVPGPHGSIMAGLNCGNVCGEAWPELATGVDYFVTVTDAQARNAMRDLARQGITAGESGAAGLAGLRAALESFADATADLSGCSALLVCTEGATNPEAYSQIVDAGADR